uniref:Alpha-2-macroglobulin receptor-associated protein domain-containing protein n=1 Tax=Plectus sambesii TaxID=2011161 RepID=A0A914X252_9BILA
MQKLSHRFLHLFLVLCLIRVALSDGGGKYSKSANEERQFRVQKLNFVWSKAVRQLERPELKRLEMELDELDSAYLAAKDAHFSGKDRDKQQLVDLDKQLRLILRQLNVENILDALEKKAKWAHEHEHAGSENDVHHDDRFSDQRLTELWQSAKNAGFSKDELKGTVSRVIQ